MRRLITELSIVPLLVWSSLAQDRSRTRGPAPDACALVSSTDISAMLGQPVGPGVGTAGASAMNAVEHPVPGAVYAMCGYNATAGLVTVQVAQYPSAAAARQGFQAMQADEQHSTEARHSYVPDADGTGFSSSVADRMRAYTAVAGLRSVQLIAVATSGPPVAFDKMKAVVQAALKR